MQQSTCTSNFIVDWTNNDLVSVIVTYVHYKLTTLNAFNVQHLKPTAFVDCSVYYHLFLLYWSNLNVLGDNITVANIVCYDKDLKLL